MSEELNQQKEMEYLEYKGNRFLVDEGVLKDVFVETEEVFIPETVKEIKRHAFLNARAENRMKLLFIPASVKKIDRLAFAGQGTLCYVEIGAGITTLEPGTFRNCSGLERISLPITLRRIESRVFENCTRLYEVILETERVSVSEDAFFNCISLKNSRIDAAIAEEIRQRKEAEEEARNAKYPFLNKQEKEQEEVTESQKPAKDLTENPKSGVEIREEEPDYDSAFCIRDGVLVRFEGTEHSIVIPEGVTTLGERVFYGMKQLEEISFPSTLSCIGAEALEGTGWLSRERQSNTCVIVNGILVSAFYESMVLEAKLPETIWRIAPYAFYRSDAGTVFLPESVKEIDAYAFVESGVKEIDFSNRADVILHNPVAVRCNKLKELYIPGKIERLGAGVVEECPTLQRVCIKGTQTVVHKRAFPESVRIWTI